MKTLVAYFSKSGKTKVLADKIAEAIGADIFEIKTVKEYPQNYFKTINEARKEFAAKEYPELVGSVDISEYDKILIGFPVWMATCPMAVMSFLKQHDFSGKDIYPFCTSSMTGCKKGTQDIAKACPNATVHYGVRVNNMSIDKIKEWVK